ncbi:hypothetical protein [Hoeflea sp. AS16]|uniref:hypothetical protein n=1 Tax=unclassified Hoeflea TaxID=2614931 RepID=UPI00317F0FFA
MAMVSVVILSQFQAGTGSWPTNRLRQSGATAESGLEQAIFNANLTEAVMHIIYRSFLSAAMGH